jgi:cyclopropane fatty-acyl-phospholipid synthase-like methyltransferase
MEHLAFADQQALLYSDEKFDNLFSSQSKLLSPRHWTPLAVARKAARFLATAPGVKVLDIGSGVGKFCLTAAQIHQDVNWFGIEQRTHLVAEAKTAKRQLALSNVTFITGNFTQLNLASFNNFYFFNSFYENLEADAIIDETVEVSKQLFHYYHNYLYRQFSLLPSGTRLASFHSLEDDMPCDYKIVGKDFNDLLTYWIKI